MPTVELHAILVEYAEDGAAAAETADRPDVVDGVTAVVHRADGAFTLLLRLGGFRLGTHIEVALQALHITHGIAEFRYHNLVATCTQSYCRIHSLSSVSPSAWGVLYM